MQLAHAQQEEEESLASMKFAEAFPAKLCARFFPFLGWKIWIFGLFGILWNFDIFMVFLGVRTGPNGFLDVLASFLVLELLKMVD